MRGPRAVYAPRMGWLLSRCYDVLTAPAERAGLGRWRDDLLGDLKGVVLELGSGTGRNLPHYGPEVTELILTEPDRFMRDRTIGRLSEASIPKRYIHLIDAPADDLPIASESVDAVVATLVLCTVPHPETALAEVRRILRPGGRLMFIEHVAAKGPIGRFFQHMFSPVWWACAGRCHLTRDTADAIEAAGFHIEQLEEVRMPRAPFFVKPTIRGFARNLA